MTHSPSTVGAPAGLTSVRRSAALVFAFFAVAASVGLTGCSSDDATGPPSSAASSTTDRPQETTTTTAPPLMERNLPTSVEPAGVPGLAIYRPTDLDATGDPAPVIVWANGGCVRYEETWAPLLERWASAGFVVVAITSLPDRQPSLTDPSTIEDHGAAIDWAEEQNAAAGSPYEGRLDLDHVVAAGNSCGGISAIGLAATDDRVKAVFVLSGSSTFPGAPHEQTAEVMARIDVPVGYAVGSPQEDIASGQVRQDLDLLGDGIGGFIASRNSGDHVTVSTTPEVLAEVADISINWLDLVLNKNEVALQNLTDAPCSDCPPGTWTVESKDLEALVAS